MCGCLVRNPNFRFQTSDSCTAFIYRRNVGSMLVQTLASKSESKKMPLAQIAPTICSLVRLCTGAIAVDSRVRISPRNLPIFEPGQPKLNSPARRSSVKWSKTQSECADAFNTFYNWKRNFSNCLQF